MLTNWTGGDHDDYDNLQLGGYDQPEVYEQEDQQEEGDE